MPDHQGHTDTELVTLLRQGDSRALTGLYYRHVRQLKYYVQRTVRSPFLAEDIVHDTFVKVWENRLRVDPGQPFKPYLFTIAKRTLLNLLKRAQHEKAIVAEIRKYAVSNESTTELQLDYNETNSLIAGAVNSLSGQCREVFVRCRLQGLSYKQTAMELGITESTVNKHMSRALSLIREYINLHKGAALLLICIAGLS